MLNISFLGLFIITSIIYTVGYLAGEYGGFLNLFDVSEEFKQKVRKILSNLEFKFFGTKKDAPSAK